MDEYKIIRKNLGDFDMYRLMYGDIVVKSDSSLYEVLKFAKNEVGLKTVEVMGVERYIGGDLDES